MDEFNDFNYFSESYYNPNNYNLNQNFSLTNSLKYNNYNNYQDNRYQMNSISQMIDNSQNSLSLIQIKNDLDQLNNKMNAISQTLYNMNKINNSSKKKINLKKSNSMKSKYNQNYYDDKLNNIKGIPSNNIKNKKINKNINESYNYIFKNDNLDNKQDYSDNNYFSNSMNITLPKNNKKIQNIKLNLGLNSNKNNTLTFDESIKINDLVLSQNKAVKNNNNSKNSFFGLYDRYFLESLTNSCQNKEEEFKAIKNNKQNTNDIMINKSKNNNNIDSKIYNNNENNNKCINYNNTFNLKNKLDFIFSQKQSLSKKLNNQDKINKFVDNKNINKEGNNKINNDEIKIQNDNQIIYNLDKKINNIKEEQENNKRKNEINNIFKKNIIKNNKNKKILSFHEEDNISIEYNPKDEITKINVYNFFGENQNFQPRNINVILEKLKRRKMKTNSVLYSNSLKKILKQKENLNHLEGNKKIKRAFSAVSICSDKEKLLLRKYKLKRRNSNSKNEKNYAKKRNKICDKFRNNPQLFYGVELCEQMIKTFDIDGIHLKQRDIKTRNYNDKIDINLIYDKKENKTEIYNNENPNKYLQKIEEEEE